MNQHPNSNTHSRVTLLAMTLGLAAALLTLAPVAAAWWGLNPGGSMDHQPTMQFVALSIASFITGIGLAVAGMLLSLVGLLRYGFHRGPLIACLALNSAVALGWIGYLVLRDL
jgi:hypothetical protein